MDSGCAVRFGGTGQMACAALRLKGQVMPGADEVRSRGEWDKLTIAGGCADLRVSQRTCYECRAKGRALRVRHATGRQPPRPPMRVPAVAPRPLVRQAMAAGIYDQACMFIYGKASGFFSGRKAIILRGVLWA